MYEFKENFAPGAPVEHSTQVKSDTKGTWFSLYRTFYIMFCINRIFERNINDMDYGI